MYRLGIDLGGTNIAVGVVDDDFKIVGRAKTKTNANRPYEEIVDDIAATVLAAVEDAGLKVQDIVSMGIGTPGSVDPVNGVVKYTNNLPFKNLPICDMLKNKIGVNFYIDNDANAAAFGEYLAGAGKNASVFVAITLGTGVGGGIVINDSVFSGSNYAGGELGHTVIVMDGEPCTCGRRGCFEAYASATALVRQTKKAMKENLNSLMWTVCGGDIDNVNGITAFDAWKKGDETATKVVNTYFKYISVGLANIINIFQPEVVCIGGGISGEKERLTDPVNRLVNEQIYGGEPKNRVTVAQLGNDAGIIGAAFLDKMH